MITELARCIGARHFKSRENEALTPPTSCPAPSESASRPVDRYIWVSGSRIRYWDEGTGPPLVLLHGLGTGIERWSRTIVPFSRHLRVLAPDLPGFGLSDRPSMKYTPEDGMAFLAEFLDSVGLHQTSLCGNSLGGLLAGSFALAHPERIQRLILVAAAGLGCEIEPLVRAITLPIIGELLAAPTRWKTRLALRDMVHNPAAISQEMVETVYHQRTVPGSVRSFLAAARSGVDLRGQRRKIHILDRLGEWQGPALIVWGRQDRIIPVAHAEAAHRAIGGSRLHIFDQCGHAPMLDWPEDFARVVLEFLTDAEVGTEADAAVQLSLEQREGRTAA